MMKEYRFYVLGRDGSILSRHELLCFDEEEAKERARQIVDGWPVELWQGDRRIETFKPAVAY